MAGAGGGAGETIGTSYTPVPATPVDGHAAGRGAVDVADGGWNRRAVTLSDGEMRTILSYDALMKSRTPDARPLAELGVNVEARVAELHADEARLQRRLADLGFVPGEYVRVLARGAFGGEPLAVRVGRSTFALRRHEAACIRVLPQAG